MRQALHIFRKDVRRCWPQIAIVLGLTAVVTAQLGREPLSDAFTSLSIGLYPLMVLSWFYLIPVVVHAESSIGHRQFWLTRPYSWKSLLTAKLLLIVVCINLSALVSDVVILLAQGLSPHEGAANLFWRQMFLIYVFVLPSLALATVTRNLAQFAGIALGLIVGVTLTWEYCRVHNRGWGTLNWVIAAIACAVVIAGTAVAVLCQYARSGLLKSSCILAATMTLWSGIVWANANVKPERGYEFRYADRYAKVRLAIAPNSLHRSRRADLEDAGEINLPVVLKGLPAGAVAQVFEMPPEIFWNTSPGVQLGMRGYQGVWHDDEVKWLRIPLHEDAVDYVENATMYAIRLQLTIYSEGFSMHAGAHGGTLSAPGRVACAVSPRDLRIGQRITCRMPYWPGGGLATGRGAVLASENRAPITAVFGPWPYYTIGPSWISPEEASASSIDLIQLYSAADIYPSVDLRSIRLTDYLVTRK